VGAPSAWSNELSRADRLIWLIIGSMTAVFAVVSWRTGICLDIRSTWQADLAVAGCLAISWFYRRIRPDPWIAMGARTIAQLAIILTLGVLLSYVAAAPAFPYRDADFHSIDQRLGLDSLAYLHFLDARPLLHGVIGMAYASIRLQTVLVVCALVAASDFGRLQRYVIAVAVALVMTLTVFVFLPAGNIYTGLDISPKDFPNLSLPGVFDHVAPLAAARNGASYTIDFNALAGLISFPSFHTASAIMFSWALFSLPKLRWGVLALNVLMVAGTPIDGGHYFIDLAGGAAVAWLAILCAAWLQRAGVPTVRPQMRGRPEGTQAAAESEA
jgi:membrane-associated phospholipid phosphatase